MMKVSRSHAVVLLLGIWFISCQAALAATPRGKQPNSARESNDGSYQQMVRRVDELMAARWSAERVEPARPASDAEFLRRAYLDLAGVIPRASEVRAFLADSGPEKRLILIESLLASPRHATHMATTWRNRIIPFDADPARSAEAVALQKWLRTRFAKNLRYDNLVGELLLTLGGDELGPALYFQANDLSPEKLAASAAELFLGVQLHCAQCHDHPTAAWSQRDFWGLAAFFARVQARDERAMGMSVRYRLVDSDRGEVQLPESNETVSPKFPGGEAATDDEHKSRRVQLAIWMTSRDNPFFARAAVNWAWGHLFGQGLVDSMDEVIEENAAGNAPLLNELADYFASTGFNLQQLWRTLASTRAYHLSSQHSDKQKVRPELFARMLPKALTPEQFYDSFMVLAPPTATSAQAALPAGAPAGALDEDPVRADFVRRLRAPPGRATEYRAGTLQALMLMNGQATAEITSYHSSRLIGALTAPFMSDEDCVESLYLATLSRPPAADELEICKQALAGSGAEISRERALSDLLWALVNSTEFAFNH